MTITPITVAHGDGIGPEIMQATLHILRQSEARIRIESVQIGEELYKKQYMYGIADEAWDVINRNHILLKAPITTPQGGGYKSLNVTLRKALGLYANVRPAISYHPFTKTLYKDLDIVIIRENEEDLYTGIEYRHTHNVYESLKLISRTGCQKIIRYAFDYAIAHGRKKVTCLSKDNIMKFSDGIFHKVFNEIAIEYPSIKNEHYIVDIGMAKIATSPSDFDVVVTSNLYGDIISDITAQMSGSVGLAGSANIGTNFSMFEAIHGSAPDIADKNIANPSGLINAAILMLVHIKQYDIANNIENAWKKTIEDGIHTADIFHASYSKEKLGTQEFAQAVAERLGQKPVTLKVANYGFSDNFVAFDAKKNYSFTPKSDEIKKCVGVDIYISLNVASAHDVFDKIKSIDFISLELESISSMGLKLWPRDDRFIINADYWACRFVSIDKQSCLPHSIISQLINNFTQQGIDFVKIENLYQFDNELGYSLVQGI